MEEKEQQLFNRLQDMQNMIYILQRYETRNREGFVPVGEAQMKRAFLALLADLDAYAELKGWVFAADEDGCKRLVDRPILTEERIKEILTKLRAKHCELER